MRLDLAHAMAESDICYKDITEHECTRLNDAKILKTKKKKKNSIMVDSYAKR